jgi:hypothetical protein
MEYLTKKMSGNRFSMWPDPDDNEFVWIYSKRDRAHITGCVGPLRLDEYPELKTKEKEGIDTVCLKVIRTIIDYSFTDVGFQDPSPDGFPILKYSETAMVAALANLLAEDMWNFWMQELPNRNIKPYTFFEAFIHYLRHFGVSPCIYVTECCTPQPDLFAGGAVRHRFFGEVQDVSKKNIYGIDYLVTSCNRLPIEEKRFTVSHELGHILMRYVTGKL